MFRRNFARTLSAAIERNRELMITGDAALRLIEIAGFRQTVSTWS